MAEMCPNCKKKTGMDIGPKDKNGRQKYQCQLCKFEWKS